MAVQLTKQQQLRKFAELERKAAGLLAGLSEPRTATGATRTEAQRRFWVRSASRANRTGCVPSSALAAPQWSCDTGEGTFLILPAQQPADAKHAADHLATCLAESGAAIDPDADLDALGALRSIAGAVA